MSSIDIPPNIYKNKNRWVVKKSINGKKKYYKSFANLFDAIEYRNMMAESNWTKPALSIRERFEVNQRDYYIRISLDSSHRWYKVKKKGGGYLDRTKNIYEALYYRDLYSESDLEVIPKIEDCDLVTNNPYLVTGLKYPLPERLVLDESLPKRGRGKISKKSVSSYSVYLGRKHICSCRTYEQAFYVKQEMNKVDWNIDELQRILYEYPVYYTWLLQFYIYLSRDSRNGSWLVTIPKDKSDDGKLQHIRYSKLEDALWERDFLVENDWDYELLVTNIDDRLNPYYDMDLPPYPERKIRNISPRKSHDKELLELAEILREEPDITVEDWARRIGTVGATLRNWFKQYGTNTKEFKKVVLEGKNPCEVFKQEDIIYTPDLSKSLPGNFSGYVHYVKDRKSKYIVNRKDIYYGAYSTRKIAEKVVKELEKVNWDKSKLDEIKKKLGICKSIHEFMYLYKSRPTSTTWQIRKKMNGKNVGFGTYEDIELAKIARDILVSIDFKCNDVNRLREFSERVLFLKNLYYSNMFGGIRL